jgi:hypothetical protein
MDNKSYLHAMSNSTIPQVPTMIGAPKRNAASDKEEFDVGESVVASLAGSHKTPQLQPCGDLQTIP